MARGRLLRWLAGGWRHPWRASRQTEPLELIDGSLHADVDAICPDCLTWIQPGDYIRRNAYGLLEHEVCPPERVHGRRRG